MVIFLTNSLCKHKNVLYNEPKFRKEPMKVCFVMIVIMMGQTFFTWSVLYWG